MGIFDFLTPKADGLAYDPMRLPAGADLENDPVVGYDELGQKVRRSRFDGTEYLFEVTAPKTQSVIKGAYREATANPLGFAGDLLSNAVQSAWDAISVPRRAMEGQPLTYGDIAGLTGAVTLGAGAATAPAGALRMGAAREGRPPVTFADAERAMQETPGIRAYQGSPYNFAAERLVRMPDGSTQYIVGAPDVLPDVPAGAEVLQDFPLGRMRMDKIGTGEGNQSYGLGLYNAEAEDVAKTYRDTLSQNNRFTPYVTYKAEELLKDAGGDYAKAADAARQLLTGNLDRQQAKEIGEVVKLLDDNRVSSGRMYEVRINADPNAMLDWDKPLSEQPQTVKDLFEPRIEALRGAGMVAPQDPIGESLWRMAYPQGGLDVTDFSRSIPEQASERLLNAGIPGIKYLDQGSRSTGAGSRNFVVFDENLISIVRKYGIAGAAVMLGTSADQISQTLTENMTQEELNNLVSGA